jgi:hypothetical protein
VSPGATADWTFTTVDVPTVPIALSTTPTGLTPGGVLVGAYTDAHGFSSGFLRRSSRSPYEVMPLLTPQGITSDGTVMVGWYGAPIQGFLLDRGTFTSLRAPQSLLTEPAGISDERVVIGDFRSAIDRKFYGFLFDRGSNLWSTVAYPGAESTALTGISTNGTLIVGFFFDAGFRGHGLMLKDEVLSEIVIPGLSDVQLVGVSDAGVIAGIAGSAGFVLEGTTVQTIQVPNSTSTALFGITPDGQRIYGAFIDAAGQHHGFIATRNGNAPLVASLKPQAHGALAPGDCPLGSRRAQCRGR